MKKVCPSCGSLRVLTERRLSGISECDRCNFSGPSSVFADVETNPVKITFSTYHSEFIPSPDFKNVKSIDFRVTFNVKNLDIDGIKKFNIIQELKEAIDSVKSKYE